MKVVENADLRVFVDRGLKEGRSPESIAGRLKHREKKTTYVSKEGIKTYLKSVYGRQIESLRKKLFPTKKPRKKSGSKGTLDGRKFIAKRPQIATLRQRVGDVEADFILSGKHGQGILLTVADRKVRVSFIEQILIPTIKNMERAFLKIKRRFPEMKTITTDNDLLFKHHQRLEKILNVKIYFCIRITHGKKEPLNGQTKRSGNIFPKGAIFLFILHPS